MKILAITLTTAAMPWLVQSALAASPVLAKAALDDDSPVPAGVRVRDYDEIFSDSNTTSGAFLMRARAALKAGDYRKSIVLAEKGLKMDSDDADLHLVYAEAMEAKLKHQVDKDPVLFQKVVERWLMILRNQVGEEKGMDVKGISITGNFYDDEERNMEAKRHLIKLTGYAPKMFETNARYLKRVLKPATTTVTARIREDDSEKDEVVPKDLNAGHLEKNEKTIRCY